MCESDSFYHFLFTHFSHKKSSGQFNFCLYRMTKPWDHAAGALMLTEAGGDALRFNGQPYRPADRIDSGIIASPSRKTLADVRAVFEAVQMPLLAPRPES